MPSLIRTNGLLLLALAAGFAVAYTQSPLFYSNQNQYLLHGLAAAGHGHLAGDWLANTKDPTPAFSLGVELAYRTAGLWPLQAAYFVLVMGYFLAMWWLVSTLPGVNRDRRTLLGFAALFTVAHAAIPRWLSVQITGVDYPFFLQSGVAGQYLLGPGLQPSAFGVLLVAGLAAFAHGRPYLAAALGAASAIFHPTYLLPAALLTAGYFAALLREKRTRTAVGVGAVSLAVAAPVIFDTVRTFAPANQSTFAEAQHILATVRIPHHAVVSRWFDGVAAVQVAWVALGISLLRKARLARPLLVSAVAAVALTLLQLVTGNDTLALLFPWRVSAVLVPVVTAVVAVKLAARIPERVGAGLFAALVASGVAVMALGLGYRVNEDERPVLDYVRERARPGDVYLIPVRIPAVGSGRGSMSASFTPPPRPKPGSNLIPVDLQRFRLDTGAPIFVDFKSVPYADTEVLEWYARVQRVDEWYKRTDWDAAGLREQFRTEGITHVLIPRPSPIRATFLEREHEDEAYTVYRVR